MIDYLLTKEEVENLLKKEETNQEDVPRDVLKFFPDYFVQHNCCPRCKKNSAREQISGTNEPLRFQCRSCGGVSFLSDWE